MRYRFKDFEFDSKSLVLGQGGQSLAIRHNEAKLLALLLEQADEVLSKQQILSLVWQEKVVSEQAVFQNISHLRNLFGNEAIKTYPKRGYQWQLPIEVITSEIQPTDKPEVINAASKTSSYDHHEVITKQQNYWPYIWLASIMVITLIVSMMFSNNADNTTSPAKKIAYIPLTQVQDNINFTLEDNAIFDFSAIETITTEQFQNTIELSYKELAPEHPLILTGQIRRYKQQNYIDFIIKGPFADWQGQLSADTSDDAIEKLRVHLQQEVIYDLLNQAITPEIKQANLSIAHQQSPNDLIVLGALINSFLSMNELEKAMVLADKLANIAEEQGNWQQLGNALLFQSKVLTRKELYELSSYKLTTAISYFEQIGDLKRQADAWFAHSWLDHQAKDYPAIKVSLLTSANLALSAADVPRELDALTYLSILAYKHKQATDKYLYLQQAENKMKAYKLPSYHFAKVPFHYAIFAKALSDKEPHWKQVLEYTKLTPDHWVAQSSRKQLMRHFIKEKRLTEADALMNDINTDNAENSYLRTLLAQAKQENEQFNHHAQRTFEQARLAGQTRLSLDVALLLCSEPNTQVNFDFYSQYITENADKYWRQDNKEKLLALNF